MDGPRVSRSRAECGPHPGECECVRMGKSISVSASVSMIDSELEFGSHTGSEREFEC